MLVFRLNSTQSLPPKLGPPGNIHMKRATFFVSNVFNLLPPASVSFPAQVYVRICSFIQSSLRLKDAKVEHTNAFALLMYDFFPAPILQVEPLMDLYKPPFIKRIYFKKLTFGDAPFRIEGIRVEDRNGEAIQIETDFRWSGDMSIHLAIETLAGGSATRMVPKVSDVAVSGTARVILMPLLPEIPGFGAATVSLMKPPVVKFHLDFGAAFGGSYSAKMIQAWLDPFLRSTVAGMMVWPKRMVVPILGEEVTGPLDDLYQRHKGALQVRFCV
jgi:hypothetical protein